MPQPYNWIFKAGLTLGFVAAISAMQPVIAAPDTGPVATLSAKYEALNDALRTSLFQRPLLLNSVESSHHIEGDAYARIDHPFSGVHTALQGANHWCDI